MLDFALKIHRHLGNRPDGKSPSGTQRDILTVRFTVRLKGIPAIDLDSSRQTFAHRINAFDPVSDSSRQTPIDRALLPLDSAEHAQVIESTGRQRHARRFYRQDDRRNGPLDGARRR